MKIEGPGKTSSAAGTKKKGSASKTDGSFGDFMASGPKEAGGAGATQSIARVDALLAVQGVEDPTEKSARRKAYKRADKVLDELDKVRMAMLRGTMTIGHMVDIADVVASHRERIQDPALTAVLDEIDLRAQVELAKMRAAIDKAKPGA